MTGELKIILFSDIFCPIIVDYLVDYLADYEDYMEDNNPSPLILFADTCKTLRKYKFFFRMKLNKFFSNLFYNDSIFRKQVTNHIERIKKKYLNNSENLLILDLYRTLDIQVVNNIFDNIYYAKLSYSINIINPSALKNVQHVDLSYCTSLEDVSDLCNVNTLNLSGCRNCTGINKLTNVYNLNISYCKNVTCDDLQYLTNVEILTINGCEQIKTLKILPPKLTHLYFLDSSISDLNNESNLNLITVNLSRSKIINVSNLYESVLYLFMTNSPKINTKLKIMIDDSLAKGKTTSILSNTAFIPGAVII